MKLRTAWMTFLLVTLITSVATLGQQDDGVRGAAGTVRNGKLETGGVLLAPAALEHIGGGLVKGQPYSAELVIEHKQTLLNGTHIDQKREMSMMYRDSEGRTRTERLLFTGPLAKDGAKGPGLRLIHIYDPVEGYSYTLDPDNHIAHRITVPIPSESPKGVRTEGELVPMTRFRAAPGKSGVSGALQNRQIKHESLGTDVIDGLTAEGRRTSITTPAGVEGNDKPLTRVCEHWTSSELKITILSKCSDPRSGSSVMRIQNLDRAEPDPLLFQVPPDYTVDEQTGPYVIGYHTKPESR